MPKRSALFTLLQVETEPTQKYYNEVVDETTGNPQQISGLVEENVRDDVLILLTTHHHRLAQFFRRLRSIARQTSKSAITGKIAAESVELLIDILPYLHQLLHPTKVLDFLLPALDVCFAASQRPALRELASVLTSSGTLLEHLVSDHLGVEVIRQWASMQSTIALDAGTLSLWTERLITLKKSQEDAMTCLVNIEISQGVDESVDAILCHNRGAEALLDKAEEKMSDQCLVELVNQGMLSLLEAAFKAVEEIAAEVEQTMLDAVSVAKESSTRLR